MKRLALLNSETLLGREMKDALSRRPDLSLETRLLTAVVGEVGTVTEGVDGAAIVQEANTDNLADVDVLITCPGEVGLDEVILPEGITAIHLASSLPFPKGTPIVAGINLEQVRSGEHLVSPHPAVVALAHLLHPLRPYRLAAAACWVILPASSRGQEGVDELLEQTRAILNFQTVPPTEVFGQQLAFNLLPEEISGSAIASELARVLPSEPSAAVQVLQAGVFHGVAAGAMVQLQDDPELDELRSALIADRFLSAPDEPMGVGPVAVAGDRSALLAGLERCAGIPAGFALWAVVDNLTLGGADNALAILETLTAPRH